MSDGISLIVGLGNPGPRYRFTRHNAGALFLEALCDDCRGELRPDGKFFGSAGRITVAGHDVRLLLPATYMNHSGKSVAAMAHYFKIDPGSMLVAYDDLDLPPGTVRLKSGGGHGGHKGLRDTIGALGTDAFHRLRIGIGHPGSAELVTPHVLNKPSISDRQKMEDAIDEAVRLRDLILGGDLQRGMTELNGFRA